MAVRKTDSEFGGRGGVLPPAEFQLTDDLEPWQKAMLDRRVEAASTTDDRESERAKLEKRALKNDTVGKRAL